MVVAPAVVDKTVADLDPIVSQETERFQEASLDNVTYEARDDFDVLHLENLDVQLDTDTDSLKVIGKFLDIPGSYLKRIPPRLRETNIQHFLQQHHGQRVIFEATEDNFLTSIYNADSPTIPRRRVVGAITRAFSPEDHVHRLNMERGMFSVDISSASQTRATSRNPGDITEGGIKVVAHMKPRESGIEPYIASYLHRLWCSNGMYHEEERGIIRLKGASVEEVLDEMEAAAQFLLSDVVPERLEQFANLDTVTVDNVEQYIHRLAQDYGISRKVKDEALTRAPSLEPEDRTAYGVVNLITEIQNDEVPASQFYKLQELGGSVVARQGGHRCTQCASLLD